MRAIGQGPLRFAIGGACLSFLVLLSGVTSGKEIKAQETPLKTRLEWTNSANKVKHRADWSSGFTSRFWSSSWAHFDRYLFVVLVEAAPNVYWKDYTKKLSKRKEIANAIKSVYSPDAKLKIDFDSKFDCSSFTCVPFMDTVHPQWTCMFYSNNNFVSNRPKSEGVLERGSENSSILKGFYCKKDVKINSEEIREVVGSFYLKRS